MKRIEVPFLVVGAGPVGMLSGILLARAGRDVLLVERRASIQTAPAAHVINARTLEIFRQAGVDMRAIEAISTDPADGGQVLFMTRLAGEEIGRLPFEQQGDDCLRHTPTPLRNVSQHDLEPILAETLKHHAGADIRYGQQWESAEQDEAGVTSIVRDVESGEALEVRSRWVIAADGAGSRVRKSLGIEMDGPPSLRHMMMIHFGANLRPIVKDRPGILYWLLDPECGEALIAHDIEREWVYMHTVESDDETEADYDDARCEALVRHAIGEDVPLRILHRGAWNMSCQVAERMREGRIFLAGDAAHRFPPTGGLGLNSGVQDAHGLAWKLCAVEDGWAGDALLDTYEIERRPVARNNAEQSLHNASKMILIAQAFGFVEDPTPARMRATLADPAGRARVQEAIAEQAEHFDLLGLALGFAYAAGAIVPDGSEPPAVANPVRDYVASSRPGARLPHAWVEREGAQAAARAPTRCSTLDLVAPAGFTLLSQGEHDRWAEAVASAGRVPMRHLRAGVDFTDRDGHWAEVCELEPTGALLVRPDQHVAWRSRAIGPDSVRQLEEAITGLVA